MFKKDKTIEKKLEGNTKGQENIEMNSALFLKLIKEIYPGIYDEVKNTLVSKCRTYKQADILYLMVMGRYVEAEIKIKGEKKKYRWKKF